MLCGKAEVKLEIEMANVMVRKNRLGSILGNRKGTVGESDDKKCMLALQLQLGVVCFPRSIFPDKVTPPVPECSGLS